MFLCTSYWGGCYSTDQRLRWSRGSVLAFGTQVRGSAPGRSRRIFGAKKILSTPSFGGEVKLSVPCRSFTACKRSLNVTCKSAFRQNSWTFLAHSSTFRRWVLSRGDTRGDTWWRKLCNPDRTISLKRLQCVVENKFTLLIVTFVPFLCLLWWVSSHKSEIKFYVIDKYEQDRRCSYYGRL